MGRRDCVAHCHYRDTYHRTPVHNGDDPRWASTLTLCWWRLRLRRLLHQRPGGCQPHTHHLRGRSPAYTPGRLTAPPSIPKKKVSLDNTDAAPDLEGVVGERPWRRSRRTARRHSGRSFWWHRDLCTDASAAPALNGSELFALVRASKRHDRPTWSNPCTRHWRGKLTFLARW